MKSTYQLTVHSPRGVQTIAVPDVDASCDVAELLRKAELPLNTRCGRQGLCDGCFVELRTGRLARLHGDEVMAAENAVSPLRACEYRLLSNSPTEIRVPARSLLAHEPQIVDSFCCNVTHAFEPLWQVVPAPDQGSWPREVTGSQLSDLVSASLVKSLPIRADSTLHNSPGGEMQNLVIDYRGDHWHLHSAATTLPTPAYGIAVDLGTTTVVALLVNLLTGEVAGSASAMNAQTGLGDNVLTRIQLCVDDKEKIGELRAAASAHTLAPLIRQLLGEAVVPAGQVAAVAIAGNTTMLHLLAGVDPTSMGTAPFTPQFLEHRLLPLDELPANAQGPRFASLGDSLDTSPQAHLLPGAAAYVGADITAGVFSSGMAYGSGPNLLVDIGTNGEIVLKNQEHLVGCATAAGPAFEGAGLTCGMRAGTGAISHVRLDGDPTTVEFEMIGDGKPIGLCGTAYVDFVAAARRRGLIGPTGRITAAAIDSGLVRTLPKGRGFYIASARGKEPLVISEGDIASLLQAKAAIATGILCLLRRFDLTSADIETLYLAGGFGFHMDVDNLIDCGLLPGFQRSQIRVVGNTALAGAYLSLLDAGAIEEIKRIGARMDVAELNLEPEFTEQYIDQLFLP